MYGYWSWKNGTKYNLIGEPTENAIVNIALDNNIIKNNLEKSMPRVNEIPFESTRKLMSTIHKLANGKYRVITKGAPDRLLNRCSKYYEMVIVKKWIALQNLC